MKKHTHFFLRPVRNTAFMFTACAQTQSKNNLKQNHYWYFQNLKIILFNTDTAKLNVSNAEWKKFTRGCL
jgi:hypothetical protein